MRVPPDRPADALRRLGIAADRWIVFYCTCPADETSERAAQEAQRRGWPRARALAGGLAAWQAAGLPVEPKLEA